METTTVDYHNGIYSIEQEQVRAFLLVGEKSALLLDTGKTPVDIKRIIATITQLPVTVILTHRDGDHVGNLHYFTEAFAHGGDIPALEKREDCRGVRLVPLAEGMTFDLGGRKLKILHTPGHTAGSVCLLDAEHGILFAGDTISYGPVYMFGERRNMEQYVKTLERLNILRDEGLFDTVYSCHNTCPAPASIIDDLLLCAGGIRSGEIKGCPYRMNVPFATSLVIGKYGDCSILFDSIL